MNIVCRHGSARHVIGSHVWEGEHDGSCDCIFAGFRVVFRCHFHRRVERSVISDIQPSAHISRDSLSVRFLFILQHSYFRYHLRYLHVLRINIIFAGVVTLRTFPYFGFHLIVAGIAVLVEAAVFIAEVGARIIRYHILDIVIAVFSIAIYLVFRTQDHALVIGYSLIR